MQGVWFDLLPTLVPLAWLLLRKESSNYYLPREYPPIILLITLLNLSCHPAPRGKHPHMKISYKSDIFTEHQRIQRYPNMKTELQFLGLVSIVSGPRSQFTLTISIPYHFNTVRPIWWPAPFIQKNHMHCQFIKRATTTVGYVGRIFVHKRRRTRFLQTWKWGSGRRARRVQVLWLQLRGLI